MSSNWSVCGSFAVVKFLNRLVGEKKKVVDWESTGKSLILKFSDGTYLEFGETGNLGADSNWYTFPALKYDGKEIWHG